VEKLFSIVFPISIIEGSSYVLRKRIGHYKWELDNIKNFSIGHERNLLSIFYPAKDKYFLESTYNSLHY